MSPAVIKFVPKRDRSGTTTVEFAAIAPIFFLLLLGLIEFSRAGMAFHSLEEAARVGCRSAILSGVTKSDVEDVIDSMLPMTGISTYDVDVDPDPLSGAEQWAPVTVTVTAQYSDVNWIPVPRYLGALQMSGSCTLPCEADNSQP